MPNCPSCGTMNLDEHKHCHSCGASLTGLTGQLAKDTVLEGRYIIVETLGRGGMGAVYKALDIRLNNKPVAIKEMSTNAVGTGNLTVAIETFKKEATMLIGLDHPALPRITDFFSRDDDRWYLVMDYIRGETLKDVVERRGPIPEAEVLEWAKQLSIILDYLHTLQPPVIFRDLKPSNIMITPEGVIKLIDFGIARHFNSGQKIDTSAYGSSGFAPPEQYGHNQTDAKSDIYALGATLHYLLTGIDPGKKPFVFQRPSVTVPVSSVLESVIMQAVDIRPEKRQASAKEILQKLTVAEATAEKTEFLNTNQGTEIMVLNPPVYEAPRNFTPHYQQPTEKNKPNVWLITSVVLGFVVLFIVGWYLGKEFFQANYEEDQVVNVTPAPVNEETIEQQEARQFNQFGNYVDSKDTYDGRIRNLATEINKNISSTKRLYVPEIRSQCIALVNDINSTYDQLASEHYEGQLVLLKEDLLTLLEMESLRAEALVDGLVAAEQGGSYLPAFQYGGEVKVKFDSKNKSFSADYQTYEENYL